MSIDYSVLATVSDPKIRQILRAVVNGKAVNLRQLVTKGLTQEDALQAISVLKDAQLIKETPSPINDLKTYFITATGLEVDRMVR